MNHCPRHKKISAATRWLCALLALLALPLNTPAQPVGPERWLLVFDLSPAMKKRLPATEEVLKSFFASGAEGRLQAGDNIGVWTYDRRIRSGQFPIAVWNPQEATTLTTNLIAFLRSQPFSADSQMAALQLGLGSVIASSERLTIVIFCDGSSDITGTPYDSGINQSFADAFAERKKSRQPFVVLVRTLSGKYIGCTVNFPPGTLNIPPFLAPPPKPVTVPPPPVVIAPTKPLPPVVPDLIIVGTKVGTSDVAVARIVLPPKTNAPVMEPPKSVAAASIAAPAPTVIHTNTNPVVTPPVAVQVAPPAPATNVVLAATNDRKISPWIYVGVSLLAVLSLVIFLIGRATRRPQSSLISRSMQDDSRLK
jgi:hypothetical protein